MLLTIEQMLESILESNDIIYRMHAKDFLESPETRKKAYHYADEFMRAILNRDFNTACSLADNGDLQLLKQAEQKIMLKEKLDILLK